jgi:hypothetical protein
VCVCVCVCVCSAFCLEVMMYVHTYVHTCVCVCVCVSHTHPPPTHTHTHTCMYIHTGIYHHLEANRARHRHSRRLLFPRYCPCRQEVKMDGCIWGPWLHRTCALPHALLSPSGAICQPVISPANRRVHARVGLRARQPLADGGKALCISYSSTSLTLLVTTVTL